MEDSKYLQFKFEDFLHFIIILLNKNEFILNYLKEDLLIVQESTAILPISVCNILKTITNILEIRNIDESNISCNIFNTLYDKELFIMMKNLYSLFTIYNNIPIFNKNLILQFQGNSTVLKLDCKSSAIDTKNINNWQKFGNFKFRNFYLCYFSLLNDYNYLKNINIKLVEKIKRLEEKLKLQNINSNLANCRICSKLKESLQLLTEKYNSIKKNYSSSQTEKERMVMKYATSEKCLIETQRCVKSVEKKYQDALKANTILHKRIQKTHDSIVKLTSEINSKSSEILQLRNEIEHHKNNDNSKELQLKWTQNRLKYITDAHKETQIKLNESLIKSSELTNECEQLRFQMKDIVKKIQKIEENKATILDKQLKEQQARIILERHIAEDSESSRAKLQKEFDLLLDRQRFADNENNLLITQIHTLEKECVDYKSKWNILNLAIEKEQAENQILKNEVSQMEMLNKRLESKEQLVCTMKIELNRLYIEKAELQMDIEAYRQHEMQILDFTQKLTDKNVQLQCEFTNLESKVCHLENNQKPLNTAVNKFITEIKNLEYNLSSEEKKRMQECEILAKYIAEQAFYNQKLFHRLEDLEGENAILRKKYELAIREMTRELHHYKVNRVNLSTFNSLLESSINDNPSFLHTDSIGFSVVMDERNEKYKIYNSILEKDKLLNQIIRLQKINVKRAEKLDFLEEHSRVLLEELQKKTKIIEDYNLQNNITNFNKH